jgi:polar amino acid transport system substrate-binding protein
MIYATSKIGLLALSAALVVAVSLAGAGRSQAQGNAAPRLAPRGELRTAVIVSNPVLVTRSPEGQLSGASVDLATAFAAKLGVPVRMVRYENTIRYNQSLSKDEWDIALAPRDLSRTGQLAFSDALLDLDNSYVVRPGLLLRTPDEVDRTGTRVAVPQGSPTDGFLSRTLKKAELVRLSGGLPSAEEALAYGRADVYADFTHLAYLVEAEVPGAMVMVGQFNVVRITIVVPKGNEVALPAVNDFVHDAIRHGLVAEAIKNAGLRGVRPAR